MSLECVYIENLRSLAGGHFLDIRPLTLLVGENSSGKTTVLAALGALLPTERAEAPVIPAFNREPFHLGTFQDYATYRGGRSGRASTVRLGFQMGAREGHDKSYPFVVLGEYSSRRGKPWVTQLIVHSPFYSVQFDAVDETNYEVSARSAAEGDSSELGFSLRDLADDGFPKGYLGEAMTASPPPSMLHEEATLGALLSGAMLFFTRGTASTYGPDGIEFPGANLMRIASAFGPLASKVCNVAPIRAKPLYTYESYRDETSAEGAHIPFVIERLSGTRPSSDLISAVRAFGEASGLFNDIVVKQLGGPMGSRFALRVKVNGPSRNIASVGYGISQILPPVVESLRLGEDDVITMQQPEVHLHPRAQAAFGSLLAALAASGARTYVVETHSDYLLDRVRAEVRDGTISPENVGVWFCELRGTTTTLYFLNLDTTGQFTEIPDSYGKFFLEEALGA